MRSRSMSSNPLRRKSNPRPRPRKQHHAQPTRMRRLLRHLLRRQRHQELTGQVSEMRIVFIHSLNFPGIIQQRMRSKTSTLFRVTPNRLLYCFLLVTHQLFPYHARNRQSPRLQSIRSYPRSRLDQHVSRNPRYRTRASSRLYPLGRRPLSREQTDTSLSASNDGVTERVYTRR
jgi:hypothetical protein